MKISNNALNFLLAQYRAIFKRAYIKGIASAVILTAGLAAGQAQAEGDTFYYIDSSGQYQTGSNGMTSGSGALGAYQDNRATVNDKSSAPNNVVNGQVSDGHLSVGTVAGDNINTVSGNAFGGHLNISGTDITNFNASKNDVTLHSGGAIAVNMAGAYIIVDSGNVTATENKATINGGSVGNSTYGAYLTTSGGTATASGNGVSIDVTGTNTATVTAQGTSDGIFGARIKTEDGNAFASGNYVDITVGDTASLSLGNGGNGIVGALAEGTETVSVTGNRVEITLDGDTPKSLGSVYSIQGGFALNQANGSEASILTADSNSVKATGLSIGGNSGAFIFGGRALQNDDASGSASELIARNNTVTLTNTNVNHTGAVADGALQVVGNMAVATPGQDPASGHNSVSAIGDGTTDSLNIDGGTFSYKASDAYASAHLNPNSLLAGGYALTVSGGGNAVANLNKATIKNITGTNVNLYGGIAQSDKSNSGDHVTASNNSLSVDAISLKVDSTGQGTGYTDNNIVGGFAALGGSDVSKAAATASNNTVTVTNSTYSKDNSEKLIEADIAGAIVSTTTSGAAITANQNSVTVDQGSNVKGNVFGAYSNYNGSFTGNTVSFNATLKAAKDAVKEINGVTIATGDSGTATDKASLTLNNNTVTVGANAKLTNTSIYAAKLGATNAANAENTDLIHSGNNVIFNGTQIIDDDDGSADNYALAGDDVQIGSTALIHVKNGTLNISGIADGATTGTKYYNGTGTVAAGARIANADTINVYNSLDVQGDDSLFAVSNGAEIKIDAGSAADEDDEDAVTTEKATLKITQAGLTNYLTATKDLAYDLDGDASQVKEAVDAAGAVTVTSGGTIDFKDTVLLSAFDFTSGGKAAGKINVDTSLTGGSGSYFKADTVTVAHKLATNTTTAQGKYENLDALDNTDGVAIVANTLNLGAADLSSTRSAAITFGKATVKEEINFLARTSGKDIADDAAGTELTTFNDGYHLTSEVIGSNFMLTNDQDSNKEYYTSLAGNINGVVTVEGDNGLIHIKDGDWTANDLVTVTSGGNITVGSGTESSSIETDSQPDATLSLAAGLVLDVTNGDVATVTANGDGTRAYQEPEDDFYGDNRYVALDLTHGVEMKGDADGNLQGKAVINATSGGVVLMTASDVNDLLAQNHAWNDKAANNNQSGAFLNASAGGELRVDGDITAQFRDFDPESDATNPSTNGFNLAGNGPVTNENFDKVSGRLVADSLTIVNPYDGEVKDDADYIETAAKVHLGGVVVVDDLEINDLQQTKGDDKPGTNTYASQVTIANGGAIISNSLTSFNDKLILGDGTNSAVLYFETDTVGTKGDISVNKIELASGSEIDFANGEWDASATNFILSGAGSSLIVGNDHDYDVNDNPYAATLKAGDLTMGADTYLYVAANGTASFNGANLAELTAPTDANDEAGILVEGYLTINGTAISENNTNGGVTFGEEEGSIRIANNGTLNFGNAAVNGAILADGQYTGDTVTLRDDYTKIENQGGTLRLGFASGSSFSSAAVQDLKHKLFTDGSFSSDGVLAAGGLLNLGSATFGKFTGYVAVNNPEEGLSGWTASWSDVKQDSDLFSEIEDVTTDQMSQSNITGINPGDEVKGAWGSLSMVANVPNTAQVTLAGNTTLSFAEGNNGFFISDAAHDNALGAIVGAQKSFSLVNGGKIGKVTLTNGKDDANDERNLTTLNINGNGNLTTINGIDTLIGTGNTTAYNTRVNVNSDADVTGDITGVGRVNVNAGATLHVYNPDTASKDVPEVLVNTLAVRNGTAQIDGDLIIDGDDNSRDGFGGEGEAYAIGGTIKATNIELEHHADLTTVADGLISAETITAAAANNGKSESLIAVGNDLDYETWDDAEETSYTGTGYLEVSKYLDLNGGTLMVDPAYGEATSVAAVMNFKDGSDKTWDSVTNDVGIIDGKALIGKNAALGIGATLAETREAIADFQENGSLSQEKYGSILYLNGQLTIADGSEIALNADPVTSDVDGIRRALKYTITSNKLDQFATLGLGANTAILMSEAAFEDADGKKTGTAIHFDRDAAVINANGGEIVLIGAFDASEKLNFFSDNDSGDQNGVDIVNASGADGTIKVYTQNGFLFATLKGKNQGQDVQLHVDEEKAFSVMSEASYPVVQTLISYHEDRLAPDSSDTGANNGTGSDTGSNAGTEDGDQTVAWTEIQKPQSEANAKTASAETKETTELTKVEPQTNNEQTNTAPATKVTGSSSFLNEVVTASHGAPAEQAARLAVYGGAAQVGLAAANSNSDILESRFGIGANAQSLNVAQNGMGGTLWVAPIYKSQDSDGFDAQGLDYGVDFDLYGVALGGDYKVTNEITVGAMFNVGSGSLDGQGNTAAAGTSNDFDYFGFALYGAYQAGALTVTGDLSYTYLGLELRCYRPVPVHLRFG